VSQCCVTCGMNRDDHDGNDHVGGACPNFVSGGEPTEMQKAITVASENATLKPLPMSRDEQMFQAGAEWALEALKPALEDALKYRFSATTVGRIEKAILRLKSSLPASPNIEVSGNVGEGPRFEQRCAKCGAVRQSFWSGGRQIFNLNCLSCGAAVPAKCEKCGRALFNDDWKVCPMCRAQALPAKEEL
jgi:hypothetical protein